MRSVLRFALRMSLVCAVVVSVVSLTTPPRVGGHAPYLSALSDLTVAPAFAAPSSCERQACSSRGLCTHSTQNTNCRHAAGECQTTAC